MEKNKMKIYSHIDPDVKLILEKISKYAQQAEAMKLAYWIFVQDSNPIGLVAVGKEPIQLLAPPGTPVAFINLIDTKRPEEDIEAFACEALKLATQKNVEYVIVTFPFNESAAISQFEKLDFKEFDDCYQMACPLDKTFEPSNELQFIQVKKEEMRRFIELAAKFLEGSPDVTVTEMLKNLPKLPDEFLAFYYSMEKFYFATKDQQTVGVLNINTCKGLISNIGVDPQQRDKGYGRQIMLFGLEQLKKNGCRQAFLRVHVENKPAIHLYESLGFSEAGRYKRMIWRRQNVK
jgi:ribosomal protein S18 acetylase RimI-like enzyme